MILCLLMLSALMAQEERFSVTGSRIRQLDLEPPSPVKIITQEDIANSGYSTVGGVLQDSTLSPYGGSAEQINVRGLGAENTLVLVNGRRLPRTGSFYGNRAPNVNALPVPIIERIEVLPDGASALYGSEALGAVINIITRKDFAGTSVSTKFDHSEVQGDDSGTVGLHWGRPLTTGGGINFALEYAGTGKLYTRNLDYINPKSLKTDRTSDNYATATSPMRPFPNCPEVDTEINRCRQDHAGISRTNPSHTLSAFAEVNKELNSRITLLADMFARYHQYSTQDPVSMDLEFSEAETPAHLRTQFNLNPGFQTLRLTHRVKNLESKIKEEQYTLGNNIGLQGEFGQDDWRWSVNNNISRYKTLETFGNMALIDKSKGAIISGRYDLFGADTGNTSGMLHSPTSLTSHLVDTLEGSVDGTLMEFAQGSIAFAAGIQLSHQTYKENSDPQVSNGNTSDLQGTNGRAHRNQGALYAEGVLQYGKWLEAQLAGRFDHYSDFGSTFNPKLALKGTPLPWLIVRGSVGTGFKAPELADLKAKKVSYYIRAIDHLGCRQNPGNSTYCARRPYPGLSEGNPNLKEETSVSWNIGVGVRPAPSLALTLDWWNYRLKNLIDLPLDEALELEERGGDPSTYGVRVIRDENGDIDIDRIVASSINIGLNKSQGLDFTALFRRKSLDIELNYSLMLQDHFSPIAGAPFASELGDYGYPRWRAILQAGYDFPGDAWRLQVLRNTIGGYKTGDKKGRIGSSSQYDVLATWKNPPWGGRLQVGANNAFKSLPEFDWGQSGSYIDTSLHFGQRIWWLRHHFTF